MNLDTSWKVLFSAKQYKIVTGRFLDKLLQVTYKD